MFAVKTNPYLEELIATTSINGDESVSPIARQFRHSDLEYIELPGEKMDYLGEDSLSHCNGFVVQKYPNRMLVYASGTCAALCRHCTRKRKVQDTQDIFISDDQLLCMQEYIIENNIQDVLVSGGDPLMLPPEILIHIVSNIRKAFDRRGIQGVIRLGSRVPCTNPTIILKHWSPSDFSVLRDLGVRYLNVQFNCVEELTNIAVESLQRIIHNGISVGNQSVLLKGVNDSTDKLIALNNKLYESGVRPYYLYSCDLIPGMSHFRVSLKRGIKLYESMRGYISGMANPLYIADLPDGMGKTPINPFYMKELEDGIYEFTNYAGRSFIYRDREVTIDEY